MYWKKIHLKAKNPLEWMLRADLPITNFEEAIEKIQWYCLRWRIYWITIIARTDPDLPCTKFMADDEWKMLHAKINKTQTLPKGPPLMREAVRWIAMLGGYLARKGDGEPGITTLWRGWKRLCDLTEGWSLAMAVK